MNNIETISLIFEILAVGAGVVSIAMIAFQARKETKINEYHLLQSLEEKFTNLFINIGLCFFSI